MEGLLDRENFMPIEFYRRDLTATGSVYRVYTGASQFMEVEATSAYEALVRSEVQKPLKIARHAVRYMPVLPHDLLTEPASSDASSVAMPTAH